METKTPPSLPPTPLRDGDATRHGANGNGHGTYAGGPPGRPPMRVYTVEKKKKRRWLRILLWTLLVLVLLAAAAVGALYFYLQDAVETITHTKDPAAAEAQKDLVPVAPLPDSPAVALVVGEDKRPGQLTSRSDTIMLVRLDPKLKAMTILSFPRDLMVAIPDHGTQQINQAYNLGGPKLALQTIQQLTGVQANYLIPINFKGFEETVNAFGGVWIDVDRRYYNKNLGTEATDYADIDLQPGYQKLTGHQALAYARYRHTDSDLLRVGRQQAFLREFKKRIDLWGAAKSMFQLVGIVKDNVKILGSTQKGGTPDAQTLLEYGELIKSIGSNVISIQIPTSPDPADVNRLVANPSDIQAAVQTFLHPDTSLAQRLTDQDVGKDPSARKAPQTAFNKAKVRIEVRAGTNRSGVGLADDVAYRLVLRGWKNTASGGNADSFKYLHTTIFYDNARSSKPAALALAKDFGAGAKVQPLDDLTAQAIAGTGTPISGGVLAVVGSDWTGDLAPTAESVLPTKTLAAVASDPTRDVALWQEAQGKTRLPLYMPTKLATSTTTGDPQFSTDPAYRIYRTGKYVAFHMTYYGLNKFEGVYGVDAINWSTPPITEDPNTQRTINGRTYSYYYNGPHLHRIAWHQGGITYWLSNSPVDYLSNSTMIAIAQSFVPVPKG